MNYLSLLINFYFIIITFNRIWLPQEVLKSKNKKKTKKKTKHHKYIFLTVRTNTICPYIPGHDIVE